MQIAPCWSSVVILLLLSEASWAQERLEESGPPVVETQTSSSTERPTGRVADKKFWLTGGALNIAMIADTKSTFDVMHRCARCYEANPYAAPFIAGGPVVAFTAGEAFDVGVMAVAAKMKASERPVFRHTWWFVPVALTAGHVMATRHNSGVR
jgi:hypothetical protein